MSKSIWIAGLLVVWTLCAATPAQAQIVNVAPSLAADDAPGLSGDLAQSLEWKTGNTQTISVKGGLKLRWMQPGHRLLLLGSGQYSSLGGSAFDRQVMEHLRYRYDPWDFLGFEAFVQHEYSEFRRLNLRVVAGAGLQLRHAFGKTFWLALGSAYLFEYEQLDERADAEGNPYADAGDSKQAHRWSNYLLWTWRWAEHVAMMHTTYFQPRFDDLADFRVLSELGIKIKLVGDLSLKVGATLAYDTRPGMGVEKLDTALVNSLSYHFGPFFSKKTKTNEVPGAS